MAIRDETLTPFDYSTIGEMPFYLMDVKAEFRCLQEEGSSIQ
ncbi:hypothetical protein [Virgibacillus pantothenticus]|nr:hypothetical protein [Virgibacillus pantothenticus]MEB5455088.1 hypothetical protein [Virgibacillus pantothenticus]